MFFFNDVLCSILTDLNIDFQVHFLLLLSERAHLKHLKGSSKKGHIDRKLLRNRLVVSV